MTITSSYIAATLLIHPYQELLLDALRDLFLEALHREEARFPALIPPLGLSLAQACMVCFDDQGHTTGVRMELQRELQGAVRVHWEGEVTERMRRSWAGATRATEPAACGIAILLMYEFMSLTPIEMSKTGTGFDYWLGRADEVDKFPFQDAEARLEVSGILQGDDSRIRQRVKDKQEQTKASDSLALPAYIVVVEFGRPVAHTVRR